MSLHIQPHAPPVLKPWLETVKEKKHLMFVQEPHHYLVSLGLTLVLIGFNHWAAGEHAAVWCYALFENITKAREIHGEK